MSRFPTAGHLVSWANPCPMTIQSGVKTAAGKTGKGKRDRKALPGAPPPGRPRPTPSSATISTHRQTPRQAQGPRRRRPVHPGDRLAPAVQPRTALSRPRFGLLHQPHRPKRRTRNHVRQLQALGYQVTLSVAAALTTPPGPFPPKAADTTNSLGHLAMPPVNWIYRSEPDPKAPWRRRTDPEKDVSHGDADRALPRSP